MNHNKLRQLEDMARAIALENPDPNRHISIILRKGRILSIGQNHGKTHTATQRKIPSLGGLPRYWSITPHSELAAYLKVPYTLRNGLTLVNFRFNRQGQTRMSRPCEKCFSWCQSLFDAIYFSTDERMETL